MMTVKNELLKLKNKPGLKKNLYRLFLNRINDNRLTKSENKNNHICSFFLPVDKKTRTIYLVNHIKAGQWIPPGGHIEKKESPIQCVHREFYEELNYRLDNEIIELFDLSIIKINNPRHNCKVHYDFWYLVYLDKINFVFDKKEFYEAQWFTLSEALLKIKRKKYYNIIFKLLNLL